MIVIRVTPEAFMRLIRGQLGVVLPRERTEEEERWLDDGGAWWTPAEGYDHTFSVGVE